MTTSFDLLHRSVQRKLWDMNWKELRSIQDQAIRHLLLGGGDAVIASPTASGKTEAAFLPVLSAIADSPSGSVRAMYVGPLKALINDQFRRVEELCDRLEMPVCKWHGDVKEGLKHRLLDSPAGILLITPESVEALLVRRPTVFPKLFSRLAYVVVDEMHAFMGTERGAQLVSQLHRLNKRAGCDPIRIGLSATLGEPEAALRWLRPGGPPATLIHDETASRAINIRVRGIWKPPPAVDKDESGRDSDPSVGVLARAILLACKSKTNLVFANAKARIELLADALTEEAARMSLADEIVVHHGSLSRERRLHAEERLRTAQACTAVCTNTLELGIDIGKIDEIVQVSAPWSVASLVQCVGRSGRRDDAPRVLRGFFVEEVPDKESDAWERLHLDLVQGLAAIELMLERFIEPPALGRAHLSTVVHQCLAIIAETGGASAKALFDRVAGSGAFGQLRTTDFADVLRELGRLDLIEQMGDGSLILGLAGQKIVEHYTFFAAFNAPDELRVVHGGEEIGAVALPPAPGEHLILAGRRWRVEAIDGERREVVVSPARGKRPPRFHPSGGAVHPRIHAKMKSLLLGTEIPSYADAIALEILSAARGEASRHRGFQPCAYTLEAGGTRLFVFGGSKIQRTLELVLSRAGLEALDADVGFDVDAEGTRVIAALRAFAAQPDLVALATHADRVMNRREFGPEKFDPFVAPEVWRRAYAREELDGPGAAAAALAVADALAAERSRSPTRPLQNAAAAQVVSGAGSPAPLKAADQPLPLGAPTSLTELETASDLCIMLAELATAGPLPLRVVIVPNEAHAHALRRELAHAGSSRLLAGTRFVTLVQLASEILHERDLVFSAGEESLRVARLRALFREPPAFRYFEADRLRDTPGWDRAFAHTIGDLESAALDPAALFELAGDPRTRDVADLWGALDAAAGNSWTRARLIKEATRLLVAEPSKFPHAGPTLVAMTGHEPRVDAAFVRAIPNASVVIWSLRPRRSRHAERVSALFGQDAVKAHEQSRNPSLRGERELDVLKAYFFEDPVAASDPKRSRSAGRDGSVELEQHEGIEAELEAAVTWVQGEVTRHATPLEDIALLVPRLDGSAVLLAERLAELEIPAYVHGGRPATTVPVCARLVALIRALTTFLQRDALIDLFPAVRVEREPQRHLSRSEALDVFGTLGIVGGTRVRPAGALEWKVRVVSRLEHLNAVLARAGGGEEREETRRGLTRTRELLRLVKAPLEALSDAVEPFLRGAPLQELWPPLERFLRDHVIAAGDGRRLVELFVQAMRSACEQPVARSIAGTDAHRLLEEILLGLRLEAGRFGDPAITIATIADAAGIPFQSVRIHGIAEGSFPSTPREDPVLPDEQRRRLRQHGVRDRGDRALAQLHAIDLVIRNTSGRIVLSAPRRGQEGTYRELSSIGVEAAVALGREGRIVPTGHELHRLAFAPAESALEDVRGVGPIRGTTWQSRAARRGEIPSRWMVGAHVDLARGRALLDSARAPDSLDGIFPRAGWFPVVPGASPERPLSASRWTTFLECPHRFFLEVLLKLRAPSEVQDDGALDPLTYGSLFHTVAERFYRSHGDAFVKRTKPLGEFEVDVRAIADGAMAESLQAYALGGEAVRAAQRERLLRDVRALLQLDWDLARDRVVAVERPFGTDAPLSIPLERHEVYVRGYIDRIDIDAGVTVLRDLKTGKPKPRRGSEIDPGIDAQLALYALVAKAMREAWGLPKSMGVAYVYPAGVRHTDRSFLGADYDMLEESGRKWLEMTAELGASRAFPRTADTDDCSHCAFTPVCGPAAQTRAARVLASGPEGFVRFRTVRGQ